MGIEGNSNHAKHAVGRRLNGGLPVALTGVGHRRQRQSRVLGVMFADDATNVVFPAMAPRAELVPREQSFRILIADLHRIYTRSEAGFVHRSDEIVGEVMVVYQAAVPNGAVQHLQLGPMRDPRGLP